MVMVASLNGKTTKDSQPPALWASKEDQNYFISLFNTHQVFIMGRKTYELAKHQIKHKPGILRIIMTQNPDTFRDQSIPGQLEFTKEDPQELLKRLSKAGISDVILLGGAATNKSFIEAKLVDELWLTLEPEIFSKGNEIIDGLSAMVKFKLKSLEKLNPQGTMLLKYALS